MNLRFKLVIVFFLLCSVTACTAQSPEPGIASPGDETPSEIRDAQLVGEPYIEPHYELVSAVNCDGQSRYTILERSLSQGQTTFFEVQVGIGGLVKGAIVPKALEAELEAKIQAALGRVLSNTYQQSVQVEIETQPGTAYLHTVTWNETKIRGIIEVIYPSGVGRVGFEKIIGLELGDRTSEALSCDSLVVESITPELPIPVPVEPTTSAPGATAATAAICQHISTYPGNFLSEDRVPPGTSMQITVRDGEIHTITAGTIRVAGVSLLGGRDRGSVVILLPSATYNITELNPTWNWHGAFHLDEWEPLADVLASQQMIPGTCSDDNGCSIVDVLVVGPNGEVSQYEKSGPLNVNCSP